MFVFKSSDILLEVVTLVSPVVIGLHVQTVLPHALTYKMQDTCFSISEHPQGRSRAYFHQQSEIIALAILPRIVALIGERQLVLEEDSLEG